MKHDRSRNLPPSWLPVMGWAAVIFTTSCTYISRSVFIKFVLSMLPAGVSRTLWLSLWTSCGLLVVKSYHMGEYALLDWLLYRALSGVRRNSSPAPYLVSAAACVLYAASDEWHQTFVPGRGGTWVDVMIDCGGILTATVLIHHWVTSKRSTPAFEP